MHGKDGVFECLGILSRFSIVGDFWEDLKNMLQTLLVHLFAISIPTYLVGFWNTVCRIQFLLGYPVEGHDGP